MRRIATVLLVLTTAACATPAPEGAHGLFPVVPANRPIAGVWTFDISDAGGAPMGYVTLRFTKDAAPATCENPAGYRAEVIDYHMDYDLAADLSPAYTISGPWITVNLTSGTCNAAYKFIGTAGESGATGYFNLVHSAGAESIGVFAAHPGHEL